MRIGSLIKNISNMENISNKINFDTEQSVVEKVVSGDIASFEVLIRRYNPVLYKIARSYGFNHQDAEDLMQDTHVSAYQALSKFENRSSYKTWISRIMVNKCLYKLKQCLCPVQPNLYIDRTYLKQICSFESGKSFHFS